MLSAAVYCKFSQVPELREQLLATGDRPIYEATSDKFWGIGLSCQSAEQLWHQGRAFVQGANRMGDILVAVRSMLRWGVPFSRFVVLGDSLSRSVDSDGVKLICVPGARARELLLIAYCIAELPGIERLVFHAGTNDLIPRLCDRPWLQAAVDQEEQSGWELRAQRRLEEWGSSGDHLANLQFGNFRRLCAASPSTHYFISGILPRPRDANLPIKSMQVSAYNNHFQNRLLSQPRPLNLSFLDPEQLFSAPELFQQDGLHLAVQGQHLLREIFRQVLQQNYATVPCVVLASELLSGAWQKL